jgi:DNA-binding response OmpR family regulator
LGIVDIEEASTFYDANRKCSEYDYQVLILNFEIESNDATYIIKQIREQKLGRDPFILSVLLLTSRDEAIVRRAMQAGSDSLLLIPFSTGQLKDQIRAQVDKRKPFIVTQDYIGPERRTDYRPGCSSAPQISVPNPVQARGLSMPTEQYEASMIEATAALGQARIKSLTGAIVYECNTLLVGMRDQTSTSQTLFASLSRLDSISEELSDKVVKFLATPATNILEFRRHTTTLIDRIDKINYSDIEVLYNEGKGISSSIAVK